LGYGKGFYDRFLNKFNGLSVGITYAELKCSNLPHESTDIPVDIIITDKESVRIK
jgi:5-formyltetrahydrofolate cyclo-ligase